CSRIHYNVWTGAFDFW
nr:immunoglobulin heavy chain junction region [Macaca mulatta]